MFYIVCIINISLVVLFTIEKDISLIKVKYSI